jgi:hypothetical protein
VATDDENLKRLAFALGGGALGALLLKNHYDEDRKSQAEKDDPDGVKWLCDLVGELLKGWSPRGYDTEDKYTDSLFRYLDQKLPEALEEEDDADSDEGDDDEEDNEDDEDEAIELACRERTPYGTPDILIDNRLALELKVDPNKAERDRLVGQCSGYSREWVTWAVVIDMPEDRVRELEELLKAKSLHYIEVIPFN